MGNVVGVIFATDESSVITGVDYKIRSFRLWNPDTDETDRPMDGVVEDEITIEGRRREASVFGDRVLTYDVPGQILLAGGASIFNQPFALRTWIEAGGDVIIDRAGWGQIKGEVEVLATTPGSVGDYWDLEAPHQVNAKVGQSPVAQRGGTRVVQIIGRTEKAGTSMVQLLDAGNLAQDPPVAPDPGTGTGDPNDGIPVPDLSLAASVDNPLTVATVTVDNASDIEIVGGDVYLEYLVQTATPAPTDSGTAWGPIFTSAGDDTLDLPAIPSGGTIWVRGQTRIFGTQQISDWSTWISITLGPDDDGTGGVLAPFLLALQYDSAGVLSATTDSVVAEIIKIYFLAGAAGGAAPTYAAVLASSFVDASGPPFTASALATMAEGEVRTVGAIGEDALGNRTILVTASITRAVDTGAGTGTPGNLSLTLIAGAPAVCHNVDAALREYKSLKRSRKYWNTSNVRSARLQHNVWRAANSGSELHWVYSLTGGPPFTESGVFVRADRVNFPEPGAYLPLDVAAIGSNVLFTLATKNGDGSLTLATSDVFVDTVTSSAPPESPTGDPPDDGLPSGGALCDLIHDLNARTLALADTDPVTLWPDDSPSGDDAAPDSGEGQSAPTFVADAFGAGLDAVRMTGTQGLGFLNPTGDSFTRYFVVKFAAAPTPSGVTLFDGTTGGNNALGAFIQDDGKILAQVNDSIGNPSTDLTASAWDGALHLHCWTFNKTTGVWAWYVDDMTSAAVEATEDGAANFTSDAVTIWMGSRGLSSAGTDWGREVTYSCAHSEASRNIVKAALQAIWGTP